MFIASLVTDLLVGILIGLGIKLLIQFVNGVPWWSLLRPDTEVQQLDERTWLICPSRFFQLDYDLE